jgi:hypothetical protein
MSSWFSTFVDVVELQDVPDQNYLAAVCRMHKEISGEAESYTRIFTIHYCGRGSLQSGKHYFVHDRTVLSGNSETHLSIQGIFCLIPTCVTLVV